MPQPDRLARAKALAQRWCQWTSTGGYIQFTIRLLHPILMQLAVRAHRDGPQVMQEWMHGVLPSEVNRKTLRGLANGQVTLRFTRAGDQAFKMTLVERRVQYYVTAQRFAQIVLRLLQPHRHISVETQLSNGSVTYSGAERPDIIQSGNSIALQSSSPSWCSM